MTADQAIIDIRKVLVSTESRASKLTKIDAICDQVGTAPPPPPSTSIPTTWRRIATFDNSLTAGTDGWGITAPLTATLENGTAKIVTNGGKAGGANYCRAKFEDGTLYRQGEEHWFGGSWRIPNPDFYLWCRFLNLGYWTPTGNPQTELYTLGLHSEVRGKMRVLAHHYQDGGPAPSILSPDFAIPLDRWFDVDIRVKLSPTDGQALTETYLDGNLIASSTKKNMLNAQPLHFYNAGISYYWEGNGQNTLYFDRPRVK